MNEARRRPSRFPSRASSNRPDIPDIEELERRLDVLAEEVERLRSGEEQAIELTEDDTRGLGLAPSAAATYESATGVSRSPAMARCSSRTFASEDAAGRPTGKGSQFDFLRAIIYAGYRFNDKFLFNSEIEIEHANEIFVEFAYVDYLAHENLWIRGGILLLPMGLVNEFHEPTVFLGTHTAGHGAANHSLNVERERRRRPRLRRVGGLSGVCRQRPQGHRLLGERHPWRSTEGQQGRRGESGVHRSCRCHADAWHLRRGERLQWRFRPG